MSNLSFEKIKEITFNDMIKRKEKLGLIRTKKEKEVELERLNRLIDSDVSLKPNIQSGRTDIFGVNDDLERTQIDLLIRFKQMDNVFLSLDRHKELNSAIISNLKSNIAILTDKIMAIKDTALLLSDDVVHVENFRTADSISQDESLYSDEYGNMIDYSYKVDYDDVIEAVKIPKLISINKLIATNGQKMAKIHINKQIGSGLINVKNPNNSIEKAIDTDMTTYWEENILADEPINVELDAIRYHKHNFGALCEIEITFNSMTEFNEIKITPFGPYPLDVVVIKKYDTDTPDREEDEIIDKYGDLSSIEIVGPANESSLQGSVMNDSVLYQFPTTIAKRLRVVFAQRHYIKNTFIYDKNQYEKNDLWFNTSKDVNVYLKAAQQGLYTVKAYMEKQWILFTNMLNKVNKLSDINIEDILFPKSTRLIPTTKYEYSYGLYNIGINENNYKNVGVYVSNPIKISSNVGAVEFFAQEEKDDIQQSIRHYISFVDKPGTKDWLPVISGQTVNLLEMLNDGRMNYMIEDEKFFGTRGREIQLSHIPFMYLHKPDSAYMKITILTPDGSILQDGIHIANVTNYNNPSESFRAFTNTDKIEYYFYGDKIYFNRMINKDYVIEVSYKRFIDSIRLKSVFRRKDNSHNSMTPILKGYKFVFKAVK